MADLERQEDKALDRALDFVIRDLLPCEPGVRDCKHQRVLDAVLPVVQAHEKALRDGMEYVHADCEKALRDEVQEYRNAITWDTTCFNCSKLLDRCYADTQRAEMAEESLTSLRDAVAQLADELDDDAQIEAESHPGARLTSMKALQVAARRLRSLLPQEGQTEKGAE